MSTLIDFAEKLRNQVDIVSVVQSYVQLRHAGQNLKGTCPFHREKTPSFTVSPSKQIFHCFGCGEGGDVIKFVQKAERLEWVPALKFLAERFHIEMPELRSDRRDHGEQDGRQRILDVNAFALKYFSERLAATLKEGKAEVCHYLARRQITPELAAQFGLGLAAPAWGDFLDTARKAGLDRDSLVGAGLVIHNHQSGKFYDRFRNRVVFPITDRHGRPVAFGARVYASSAAPDEPKYVNSPETVVYKKGEQLYGLHLAKDAIASSKCALIMEGYLDVIRAHQFGFTNAIATCGTALTDEQAMNLHKYCRQVVFVYDGDAAGQKAMVRGCEVLIEHDFQINVVTLPDDHDPDSFLLKEGADAFRSRIDNACDFFRFMCNAAAGQFDRNTPDGKVQIVEALLPVLKRLKTPIARHEYCHRAAEFLDLDDALILRQVNHAGDRAHARLREDVQLSTQVESKIERMLLKAAIEHEEARKLVLEEMNLDWVTNPTVRRWFVHCRSVGPDDPFSWEDLLACCQTPEDASFLRSIALDDSEPVDDVNAIEHILVRLKFHHQRKQTSVLAAQIRDFYNADPEAELAGLTQQLHESSPGRDLGNRFFRQTT